MLTRTVSALSRTVSTFSRQVYAPYITRQISCSSIMRSSADFEASKKRLSELTVEVGNAEKLKIYALFKQATEGVCKKPKPGMMDFVNKAKWDAWTALGNMSQEQAKTEYINLVNSLAAKEPSKATTGSTSASPKAYKTIQVENKDGAFIITLNRPDKKNAINLDMYNEWIGALKQAGEDPSVVLAVVTGAGDFFCSGNDLNNFAHLPPGVTMEKMAEDGSVLLNSFVSTFIDFPKPLIGLINGPAVGISVTTLALYDAVIASSKSTFHTPFSALGQSPEGCSSIIFPTLMGHAKACSMLLFNKKLTAQEAYEAGLVSEVLPAETFHKESLARVQQYAKLPRQTMSISKVLIRSPNKEVLHQINKKECATLKERWLSEECIQAVMSFLSRKPKL